MPLASDSGSSRFSFTSPRRFSGFGENFMRETISFAVQRVARVLKNNRINEDCMATYLFAEGLR